MTSMLSVRKRLELLEHEAARRNKKTSFAWLETDGYVYPHKNDFRNPDQNLRMTPEEYIAKKKALGFTDITFITWMNQDTPMTHEELVNYRRGAAT